VTAKKIKAILFDLDGTLYQHIPNSGDAFADCVRDLGYKISDEDKTRAAHWTHFYFANSREIKADEKTFTDENSFWVNFTKRRLVALGISTAEAVELAPKVSAYMRENFKPISFVPPDAFPLLKSLRSAGYTMGVVSNREKPFWEKLIDLNLSQYFEFALAAGEVNSYKPDTVIFARALELAGASAAETMYIGDNYFADVDGAQRAGILPVLYDPINLFPYAECQVIQSFAELPGLLK
jgi:putative hydrolase of the HAD superfamily